MLTLVRNLGKHDAKFLEETILIEKEFSSGLSEPVGRPMIWSDTQVVVHTGWNFDFEFIELQLVYLIFFFESDSKQPNYTF